MPKIDLDAIKKRLKKRQEDWSSWGDALLVDVETLIAEVERLAHYEWTVKNEGEGF